MTQRNIDMNINQLLYSSLYAHQQMMKCNIAQPIFQAHANNNSALHISSLQKLQIPLIMNSHTQFQNSFSIPSVHFKQPLFINANSSSFSQPIGQQKLLNVPAEFNFFEPSNKLGMLPTSISHSTLQIKSLIEPSSCRNDNVELQSQQQPDDFQEEKLQDKKKAVKINEVGSEVQIQSPHVSQSKCQRMNDFVIKYKSLGKKSDKDLKAYSTRNKSIIKQQEKKDLWLNSIEKEMPKGTLSFNIPEIMGKKDYTDYVMELNLDADKIKEIKQSKIGPEHQAQIPGLEKNSKRKILKQIWNPENISEDLFQNYLLSLEMYIGEPCQDFLKAAKVFSRFDFNMERTLENIRKNRSYYRKQLGLKKPQQFKDISNTQSLQYIYQFYRII